MTDGFVPPAPVAVVVPAFNAGATLGRTLGSIGRQTLAPAEVIVVDDGSTDATVAIARAYGARVVSGGGRSPASARNCGIAVARAEWIALLDADDVWHPEKLERSLDASAAAPEADLIATDYDEIDERGGLIAGRRVGALPHYAAYARSVRDGVALMEPALFAASLAEWCVLIPSAVLVRASLVARVGPFDETLGLAEDVEFFLRCVRVARVAFVERQLLGHLNHPGQITAGIDRLPGQLAVAQRVLRTPERYHASSVRTMRAREPLLLAKRARAEGARRRFRVAASLAARCVARVRSEAVGHVVLRVVARARPLRAAARGLPALRAALQRVPVAEPVPAAGLALPPMWPAILASSASYAPPRAATRG